jgi:hypothetical protein
MGEQRFKPPPILAPMTSKPVRVNHHISGRDHPAVQFVVHRPSSSQPSTASKSTRRKRPAGHRTVTFSVEGSLHPSVINMTQPPLDELQEGFGDLPPLVPNPDELDDLLLSNEISELAEIGSGKKVSTINLLALILLDLPSLHRPRICISRLGWLSLPKITLMCYTIAKLLPALALATTVTKKPRQSTGANRVITQAFSVFRVSFQPIVMSPPTALRSGTRSYGLRSLSLTLDTSYTLGIVGQLVQRITIRPRSLLVINAASPVSLFNIALTLRRRRRHFSYCRLGFSLAQISILAPPLQFRSSIPTTFSSRLDGLRLTSSIPFSNVYQSQASPGM